MPPYTVEYACLVNSVGRVTRFGIISVSTQREAVAAARAMRTVARGPILIYAHYIKNGPQIIAAYAPTN